MDLPIKPTKAHGKWFASKTLRAIERYGLIGDQDKVAVALSGGKDSVSLLAILDYLRRYSHLHFELMAVHARIGSYDTSSLAEMCESMEIHYREVPIDTEGRGNRKETCSICARIKRGAIKKQALAEGFNKIAFGHHADDVAHTVLMNLMRRGEFLCFSPFLVLPGGIAIVRPLVYLREETLVRIQRRFQLPLLGLPCPFGRGEERRRARAAFEAIQRETGCKDFPLKIVRALERSGLWKPKRGCEGV